MNTNKEQTENDTIRVHEISGGYIKNIPVLKTYRTRGERLEIHAFSKHINKYILTARNSVSIDQTLKIVEKWAVETKIFKYQILTTDELFNHIEMETFKRSCTKILEKTSIVVIKPAKYIFDKEERVKILQKYDAEIDHSGRTGLYTILKKEYYWKKMSQHVAKHVKNCTECQLNKLTIKPIL